MPVPWVVPLPSNRWHLSCDGCLVARREDRSELVRAVLCTTVVHNDPAQGQQLVVRCLCCEVWWLSGVLKFFCKLTTKNNRTIITGTKVRISLRTVVLIANAITVMCSLGHGLHTLTIRYDTIRDAILTCAQKLTCVSLIYCTEPTSKKWKTEKLQSKKRICSEVSLNSPGNPRSQSGRRKGRLGWEGFTEKEGFKPGMKE